MGSKAVSALWVKNEFCPEWRYLIEFAEKWQYGKDMAFKDETIEFIQYVVNKISEVRL